MTPKDIEWRHGNEPMPMDGGAPVSENYMYAYFKTPQGKIVVASFMRADDSYEDGEDEEFEICHLDLDDGLCMDKALWAGDDMLGLMCAIEGFGLTPAPDFEWNITMRALTE